MLVTIIGSLSRSKAMEECEDFFKKMGCSVNSPAAKDLQTMPLIKIQATWIESIEAADLIVAISKIVMLNSDQAGKTQYTYEFGESTSYELAIANRFQKEIMIWE